MLRRRCSRRRRQGPLWWLEGGLVTLMYYACRNTSALDMVLRGANSAKFYFRMPQPLHRSRSSEMNLPSFGNDRGWTQSTTPLSLVTARSVVVTASFRFGIRGSGLDLQRHQIHLALSSDDETQSTQLRMTLSDFSEGGRTCATAAGAPTQLGW